MGPLHAEYEINVDWSRGISKRGLRFLIIIKPLYRGLLPGGGCPEASSGGGDGGGGGCAIDMSRFRGLLQASVNATKKVLIPRMTSRIGISIPILNMEVYPQRLWRSQMLGMKRKFDGFIDLDAYDTLALKLKGDGRSYISTIYTENWVNSPGQMEDNSWQAFVFVPKDDWYIAKIPLARYLPTWRGNVIDANLEMNQSRILGMSLSVNAEGGIPGAKSGPGDFRVDIDWIKALRTQ
ncbi:hypothetical protein Tsubulata_016039 [Turnera subulata]|uniref:NADH:ubiquinone oxidoreductase intermediate-associated protein 30 domain-containing protein n=1 Tax=Turnera subulata TaxID=218843 RepID=A0A9Q0F8E7_9ROSI|nr:hypothetical protein Tsubulata_016039 [Turnera subulata]